MEEDKPDAIQKSIERELNKVKYASFGKIKLFLKARMRENFIKYKRRKIG